MEKKELFIEKMRCAGLPEAAIDVFSHFYQRLAEGIRATVPESEIVPVKPEEIADRSQLSRYGEKGKNALAKTAVIKLNGGLGTTMGLQGPKSLIQVKNGHSFLDITMKQISHLNRHYCLQVPLIIMNSFFTDSATRHALENKRNQNTDFIHFFNQHKFPKILEISLEPVSFPSMPLLEWYPAGHGDLLLSLHTSGLLERLIQTGYRYLFVSNIDNLGAEIDPTILGYFASESLDFLMEVTERTEMDRKGGHLARLKSGPLALREAAQCDPEDDGFFSDISRHRFFNTNNLWINTESALQMIGEGKHRELPMVINRKRLVPTNPSSPSVCHLESALGSAILLFKKNAALKVPRSRFIPVKNCNDLLLVLSDYYLLKKDGSISHNPARVSTQVTVTLDPRFYSTIDLLRSHFPYGAPSLVNCKSFSVQGDVKFGRAIVLRGAVSIVNTTSAQIMIEDNAVISGDRIVRPH